MTTPIDKDFWEVKHNDNSDWLTGTRFDRLLEHFHITQDTFKNKKVLEIGVGKGFCSESISNFASTLYCSDISESGLAKVEKFATKTFLTTDIVQIPAVDFAISHLVFVHCTDEEMLRIINDVNLTDDGCFMFHFSGLKDDVLTEQIKRLFVDDGSHFFRSVDSVKDIIERSNKQLVDMSPPNEVLHNGWFDHYWYYVTVQNKAKGN